MLSLEQLTVVGGLHPPISFRSVGRGDNAGHFASAKNVVYLLGKGRQMAGMGN